MRNLVLTLALLAAPVIFAAAQESYRSKLWQRNLAEHEELIDLVESLNTALLEGDTRAIGRQFQDERVGLVILSRRLPLNLYGHSQTRAILRDYLDGRSLKGLHVTLSRIEAEGHIAKVALDLPTGRQLGGRTHHVRFVACYHLTEAGWRLSRLHCP